MFKFYGGNRVQGIHGGAYQGDLALAGFDQHGAIDLADPQLIVESRTALDELTQIMKLGSVYQFQK